MSFFNWLFGKPSSARSTQATHKSTATLSGEKQPASPVKPDVGTRESGFSAMRHSRREQLFRAIRDAMTQAGVLSFRYKFKVLSQDRRGNSFVVLIDLTHVSGDGLVSISEMEALIVQSAAKRYDIGVSAVYWRCNELQALSRSARTPGDALATAKSLDLPTPAPVPMPSAQPAGNEPINADEITAFQRALLSASVLGGEPITQGAALSRTAGPLLAGHKDFEDTQTTAEEVASFPALSSTQYGELR